MKPDWELIAQELGNNSREIILSVRSEDGQSGGTRSEGVEEGVEEDIKKYIKQLKDLNIKVNYYEVEYSPVILIEAKKEDLEKMSNFEWIYGIYFNHEASCI